MYNSTKLINKLPKDFIKMLDVSLHRPETTLSEIYKLCDTGLKEGFNVITNSCYIKYARKHLGENVSISLGSTVGFPFGTSSTSSKVEEARKAITEGADEVDMVMAIGFLREGPDYYGVVRDDIHAVVEAVHAAGGGITKVIIELAI